MSDVRYYSMRRLSPYQGTVQVAETQGFRAMTSDGMTWRAQFLNQRSRLSSYAVWRADGSGSLVETRRTSVFIEAMQNHPAFPFPPADNMEFWLLDSKQLEPLAILASTLERITPPRTMETVWHASLDGDDSFMAPSLSSGGAHPTTPIPHREVLSRCVQKAAGPLDRAQWFRRESDGSGTGLHGSRLSHGQRPVRHPCPGGRCRLEENSNARFFPNCCYAKNGKTSAKRILFMTIMTGRHRIC